MSDGQAVTANEHPAKIDELPADLVECSTDPGKRSGYLDERSAYAVEPSQR